MTGDKSVRAIFAVMIGMALVSGCANYGVVDNEPIAPDSVGSEQYSVVNFERANRAQDDISLMLAFSGGGSRAAALAYGVLLELRDTGIDAGRSSTSLLDEVDLLSSVSGGSFTAAYYGLHGDGIFDDFEEDFLRRNIQGKLIYGLLNPGLWFNSTGRTEMAVALYEEKVFKGATFADLKKADGPIILINASDLSNGARFTFVQEYFDLLCSDISTYPVSRAVAASSAVPVLFNPVVVKNYQDCNTGKPAWLVSAIERPESDASMTETTADLESFYRHEDREYLHFVDGGITDNLGLRAIYDIIEVSGGANRIIQQTGRLPLSKVIIISVDASTDQQRTMDNSPKQPSAAETVGAISSTQLHRYNTATTSLIDHAIKRWARELSTPERPVSSYFVRMGFKDIEDEEELAFFNGVPTSFSLDDEQVDRLIHAGRELLRTNPEFQRLLSDLEK